MQVNVFDNIKQGFLSPFKVEGGEVSQSAVTAPGGVPTLNPCEDRDASLGFALETVAFDEFASRLAKKLSAMTLS